MAEDAAREWLAAHPTATSEDLQKEFGLDEESAADLIASVR